MLHGVPDIEEGEGRERGEGGSESGGSCRVEFVVAEDERERGGGWGWEGERGKERE